MYVTFDCADVQEPEVWHLLKDLEIAAKDHNTGSVSDSDLLMLVILTCNTP